MQVIYDFSFLLAALAALTGLVWGLDHWLWRRSRPAGAAEPWPVEYARSFFPIILIVLVVRAFLFEPFRIPSDSMMPTLLDGDFIFVSKFSYGLRLPVVNTKILATGEPQRGDVIVFRKPSDPSINYIKRLVGLPGDHIEVRGDAIWVNGRPMPARDTGLFTEDTCYERFRQGVEQLGDADHRIMFCPGDVHRSQCTSHRALNSCLVTAQTGPWPQGDDRGAAGAWDVPAGQYFFMGDNRDNSDDSRLNLGVVPEANLVGKAVRIWASFDGFPVLRWRRIGNAVH
jgi:signal peptidase I